MAWNGVQVTHTTSAVTLASLGVPSSVKSIDIANNPGSAASLYIGGSSLDTDGVDGYIALAAGKSWGVQASEGEEFSFDPSALYILGAENELAHINWTK